MRVDRWQPGVTGMTSLTLREIVTNELGASKERSKQSFRNDSARRTTWSKRWPGYGVRHYASGRKVHIVQARMDGRTRTVTIGDSRLLSEAQAIDVAKRVLLRVQCGENPAAKRTITLAIPTFDSFADEYWEKMQAVWKSGTISRNIYYMRKHVRAAFAGQFLDEIEYKQVRRWFVEITKTAGPGAANRALMLLRGMFNKAIASGVITDGSNPTFNIRQNKMRKHEAYLSNSELTRFGEALVSESLKYPIAVAAIRLLTLTGCRKSEICNLTWRKVKGRRLLLHDAKTGPRTVWLGQAAQNVLSSISTDEQAERVFSWRQNDLSIYQLERCFKRARLQANLLKLRVHDLRHSFASHAAGMTETLPMIAQLLGHANIKMTARYAHLDDRDVQKAAEDIGKQICLLIDGG